jgi:hypothetical protein
MLLLIGLFLRDSGKRRQDKRIMLTGLTRSSARWKTRFLGTYRTAGQILDTEDNVPDHIQDC